MSLQSLHTTYAEHGKAKDPSAPRQVKLRPEMMRLAKDPSEILFQALEAGFPRRFLFPQIE